MLFLTTEVLRLSGAGTSVAATRLIFSRTSKVRIDGVRFSRSRWIPNLGRRTLRILEKRYRIGSNHLSIMALDYSRRSKHFSVKKVYIVIGGYGASAVQIVRFYQPLAWEQRCWHVKFCSCRTPCRKESGRIGSGRCGIMGTLWQKLVRASLPKAQDRRCDVAE